MKYAVLAVLLSVVQTAPPVPRKTPDNSTQAPAEIKTNGQPSQTPSLPTPTPVNTDSNGPAKSDNGEQHPENNGNPVIVRQLPAVTVNTQRDWADWGAWLFNLFLVAVGALQVVLLCWTLRAIRIQAKEMKRQRGWMQRQWDEMSKQTASLKEYVDETKKISKSGEDSAKVALLNAQSVINAQRAWIVVEHEHLKIEGLEGLLFQAINKGETPADIVEAYFDHEFFPAIPDNLPLPPRYKNPIRIPPRGDNMLVTGEKWPLHVAPIHLEDMISNSGHTEPIVNATEILCLFGEIKYRDVLRSKDDKEGLHYTRFCFVYLPIFRMLLPSGPQEYREKT